jgi:hypothetical protein
MADERLAGLYLAIISRYKDYIEEKEELSVAELPTLVTPRADDIVSKADEIKGKLAPYFYDRDFISAAHIAFEFVSTAIEEVALPVQFWLTPEETLRFRAGDRMDKSILLCSLLIALGNPSAKVFMLIRDNERNTCVYFEFSGRVTVMDFKRGIDEYANRNELLERFSITDEDTAYEFNNRSYADIY